jgi:hypothetical protein
MISCPSSMMPTMASQVLPCGFASMALNTCSRREHFGLALVLLERSLQLLVSRGLCHFRQGVQDLLLGEIDVF